MAANRAIACGVCRHCIVAQAVAPIVKLLSLAFQLREALNGAGCEE